jgi:hypothetical protein
MTLRNRQSHWRQGNSFEESCQQASSVHLLKVSIELFVICVIRACYLQMWNNKERISCADKGNKMLEVTESLIMMCMMLERNLIDLNRKWINSSREERSWDTLM